MEPARFFLLSQVLLLDPCVVLMRTKALDCNNAGRHVSDMLSTERVSSDFCLRVVRFFYLEATGEAVLIRKTDRRNAISIYISVANSFTSERAFFVTKLPSAIANFFPTATALFLEFRSAECASSPTKLEAKKS